MKKKTEKVNVEKRNLLKKVAGATAGAAMFAVVPSVLADPKLFRDDGADAFEMNADGNTSLVGLTVQDELNVQGTVTINGATVTLTQDTDFVTSGGVNGMSIDGTTLSVDGLNNRIGIGTATPDSTLQVVGAIKVGDEDGSHIETTSTGQANFVGGAGLVYGGMSATNNSTETTITSAGTPVQVGVFSSNSKSNQMTPDHTTDDITVLKDGTYMINVAASVDTVSGSTDSYAELTVRKNNGGEIVGGLVSCRNMTGGGSNLGSLAANGITELEVNDTIEVWIENETNTDNYRIDNINLTVMQIGGMTITFFGRILLSTGDHVLLTTGDRLLISGL